MSKCLLVFKKGISRCVSGQTSLYRLVLFILAFIPLYPKFPLLNMKGTYVAVRLEDILIAIAVLWWIAYLVMCDNWKKLLEDKLNKALLLFFFVTAVSLFSGLLLTKTVTFNLGLMHYLRRVEFMLLLPVAYSVINTRRQIFTVLIVVLATTLVVDFYAIGQKYLDWPVISTGNSEFAKGQVLRLTLGARVNSTFAGHYDLAVFITMFLTVLAAILFAMKKNVWRIFLLGVGGFSFIVLIMTAARLSFVATIVGIISSLLLGGKKLFILIIVAVTIAAVTYPSQLRDRFISTININIQKEGERYSTDDKGKAGRSQLNIPTLPDFVNPPGKKYMDDSSASGQISTDIVPGEPVNKVDLGVYRSFGIRFDQEWPRAIRAFEKNPLLGTGYSSLGIATDNDFLRLFGEVGLLGAASFILIFVEIIKRLRKNLSQKDPLLKYLSVGILSLILSFFVNALFIDVFESSKVASLFWIILGIGLAIEKLGSNNLLNNKQ